MRRYLMAVAALVVFGACFSATADAGRICGRGWGRCAPVYRTYRCAPVHSGWGYRNCGYGYTTCGYSTCNTCSYGACSSCNYAPVSYASSYTPVSYSGCSTCGTSDCNGGCGSNVYAASYSVGSCGSCNTGYGYGYGYGNCGTSSCGSYGYQSCGYTYAAPVYYVRPVYYARPYYYPRYSYSYGYGYGYPTYYTGYSACGYGY